MLQNCLKAKEIQIFLVNRISISSHEAVQLYILFAVSPALEYSLLVLLDEVKIKFILKHDIEYPLSI